MQSIRMCIHICIMDICNIFVILYGCGHICIMDISIYLQYIRMYIWIMDISIFAIYTDVYMYMNYRYQHIFAIYTDVYIDGLLILVYICNICGYVYIDGLWILVYICNLSEILQGEYILSLYRARSDNTQNSFVLQNKRNRDRHPFHFQMFLNFQFFNLYKQIFYENEWLDRDKQICTLLYFVSMKILKANCKKILVASVSLAILKYVKYYRFIKTLNCLKR